MANAVSGKTTRVAANDEVATAHSASATVGKQTVVSAGPTAEQPATGSATGATATATATGTATATPVGSVGRLTQDVTVQGGGAGGKPLTFAAGTIVTVVGLLGNDPDRLLVQNQAGTPVVLTIHATELKLEPNVMADGPDGPGQVGQAHFGKLKGVLWNPVTGPTAEDARHQGAAGDCYFISSMAAVCAQNPQQIERLFITQSKADEEPQKSYKIQLYVQASDGSLTPQVTEVDRWVPEANQGNTINWAPNGILYDGAPLAPAAPTPAGQAAPPPAFWPELLEKAFAQLYGGNYDAIGNGGWPAIAMEALTGVVSEDTMSPQPPPGVDPGTFVLQTLRGYLAQGKAVVLSTTSQDPTTNPYGLFGPHAYQFVGISGTNILMKNPWGFDDPAPIPASDFLTYFFDIAASSGSFGPSPLGGSLAADRAVARHPASSASSVSAPNVASVPTTRAA